MNDWTDVNELSSITKDSNWDKFDKWKDKRPLRESSPISRSWRSLNSINNREDTKRNERNQVFVKNSEHDYQDEEIEEWKWMLLKE